MSIENFLFDMRSIVTVLSFASFLAIVVWAYSARRSAEFAEAANLPFADEQDSGEGREEKQHG